MIEHAREGGADAVKFQSYKAQKLAAADSPAYWDTSKEPTTNQRELFAKYDAFGPDDYRRLAGRCAEAGIDFASTPFDAAAVAYLDPLVPFFKVASADVTNVPLLRTVGRTGKPVVLSTGAATVGEVRRAVALLCDAGAPDVVLLHCVLNYPTPPDLAHLRMIEGLRREFPDRLVGYSDHTVPDAAMTAPIVAAALGAVVIEKHFTHDKALPGNDHYHAMDVDDLRRLTTQLDVVCALLGEEAAKAPLPSETPARAHARRSIVTARAVAAGAPLTIANLTTKRPASGIPAERWDEVIGRSASRALEDDHVLAWSDLS
ncbi:MAG: acetylneuraminic acid synthetase [Acidimicrobiia bacterium]|nr:acetylneuraminic acid synthetase [Acidimicrobiia bacterium]